MKKTGQIFAIIIVSVLSIIHVAIIGDFSKKAFIIDFSIAILIAWLVGRQYDKMKLYTDRMIETEKNYRQLIDTFQMRFSFTSKERFYMSTRQGNVS